MIEIRRLEGHEAQANVSELADVLLDCVEGGASVSFIASLTRAEAIAFFENVADEVNRRRRISLAAFARNELIGTVQVVLSTPPNQPHRADVAKLLVKRSMRGRGIARQLMRHVETESRRAGKTLLVLDTVTGGAAQKLYSDLAWNRVGVIPNYALFPDGTPCGTTIQR